MTILFWTIWILLGLFNVLYLLPYMVRKEIYSDIPSATWTMNLINGPIGIVIQLIIIIVFKIIRRTK